MRYNPKEIEPKWQKIWEEKQTYRADLKSSKPKYIAMSMFNYPSGAGIHIGHAMNYTISDVKARFMRQKGYESYHPVGWDAFGLPAENYAIKSGVSPQESMATIIPDYHKQYKAMGWSNDWSKEISTHEPEYYKWSQWIFSQMYKNGLAYQDSRMQWWCAKDNSVLANEQVIDGKCWRHDGPNDPLVEKKEVKQWFFKITDYADELLESIDALDWTESVKLAQKNWIGKSVGAEVTFKVKDSNEEITVFTTRVDTIFSAAFVVLAPEHDLVDKLTTAQQKEAVKKYVQESNKKTEVERQADKEKTGVFTGAYAINPANNEEIPIWIGDFVLGGYGTGAVFGDIHDERDFEFITKFSIPARYTVVPEYIDNVTPPKEGEAFTERQAVQVIVKHPTENKYLLLKKLGWEKETFSYVNGGIEKDEDPAEAALRELKEETGYLNVTNVRTVGYPYFVQLYHERKSYNLRAEMFTIALELKDLKQEDVSEEEKATNEPLWVTGAELLNKVHGEGAKKVFEMYLNGEAAYTDEGVLIDSGEFTGLRSEIAREKITAWLSKKGSATEKVNYRMRDWSVSRQRYWGAPIPIINCAKCGPVLVPDKDLPVVLPELDDFQPSGDGRSALARATEWVKVACPECGRDAERETDTLDTYIDSSWYMYRYFDPRNDKEIFDSELVKKWEPIDFYNGADHATAHLLYARFIGHFFKKLGLVDEPEPFKQFLFNGKVTASDGTMFSKSKGNGVDPLEIIDSGYGADALRMYLMFAAPLDVWIRWDPQGVPGAFRFLTRLWNLVQDYATATDNAPEDTQKRELLRVTNAMVKKMTEDLENNNYNTAIAAAMGTLNELYKLKTMGFGKCDEWQTALEAIVACVAPFAPHISEELWFQLGHDSSVHVGTWPEWDDALLVTDMITIVIQVNGKVRANIEVATGAGEEQVIETAKENEKVASYLDKPVKKAIYVPNKLINFVV